MIGLDTESVLDLAVSRLSALEGHALDVLSISAPVSAVAAANLAKIISKLSPILGNLIEFNVVEFLNQQVEFAALGRWRRQDPGFPDAIFESSISPKPGFEIKAWFPLVTEKKTRFKASQRAFLQNQTKVLFLAWMPENVIYGKPAIYDVCVVSASSIAKYRDDHYHKPPGYLVVEPNDTSSRTSNLQQTNTSGYIFQGSSHEFKEASRLVAELGALGQGYSHDSRCQTLIAELRSKFSYRLDTNYGKVDRIAHPEIESFKRRVLERNMFGMTLRQWDKIMRSKNDELLAEKLINCLNINWKKDLLV